MPALGIALALAFGGANAGEPVDPVDPPVNTSPPSVEFPGPYVYPTNMVYVVGGTWGEEFPPTDFAYQWQRFEDGVWEDIVGETNSTYVVQAEDVGCNLRCTETATNAGGDSLPAASNESDPVTALPAVPVNIAPPLAFAPHDPPQIGDTFTCESGIWDGADAVTYQWQAAEGGPWSDIEGATELTFVAFEGAGITYRCVETATNAGGAAFEITNESSPSVPVPAQPEITRFQSIYPSNDLVAFGPGKGVLIQDAAFVHIFFWANTGTENEPSMEPGADAFVEVVLTLDMPAEDVAAAFAAAMDGTGFSTVVEGTDVIATCAANGVRDNAEPRGACAAVIIEQEGVDGP